MAVSDQSVGSALLRHECRPVAHGSLLKLLSRPRARSVASFPPPHADPCLSPARGCWLPQNSVIIKTSSYSEESHLNKMRLTRDLRDCISVPEGSRCDHLKQPAPPVDPCAPAAALTLTPAGRRCFVLGQSQPLSSPQSRPPTRCGCDGRSV